MKSCKHRWCFKDAYGDEWLTDDFSSVSGERCHCTCCGELWVQKDGEWTQPVWTAEEIEQAVKRAARLIELFGFGEKSERHDGSKDMCDFSIIAQWRTDDGAAEGSLIIGPQDLSRQLRKLLSATMWTETGGRRHLVTTSEGCKTAHVFEDGAEYILNLPPQQRAEATFSTAATVKKLIVRASEAAEAYSGR